MKNSLESLTSTMMNLELDALLNLIYDVTLLNNAVSHITKVKSLKNVDNDILVYHKSILKTLILEHIIYITTKTGINLEQLFNSSDFEKFATIKRDELIILLERKNQEASDKILSLEKQLKLCISTESDTRYQINRYHMIMDDWSRVSSFFKLILRRVFFYNSLHYY